MLEPPTCSISPLALSEEQLRGAGVGPWPCLGSCPAPALMHGWELLHGTGFCAVPHPSWHLGFAWEVQDFQHGRNQHGGCAGKGSSLPHSGWFWGGFLPHEWDLCCLYFLKLELLKGFVVLVGFLPSFLWSIRNESEFWCLLLCCITAGGYWKHLGAALVMD